jgi:putative salt-induced outer membrane protein YdiY
MKKFAINLHMIFILLYFITQAVADEITIEGGDRLTGTVVSIEKGTLILKTDYSDPIRIKQSKIIDIVTDKPHEIHLKDGEILRGRIRTEEKGLIVVESYEGRKETVIAWDSVTSIDPEPVKWKGNINIGAGMQTGNTERTNASIGAEATRRSERNRFSLRFLYNYAEDGDEVSTRNTYASGEYDYFFTKKWYGYVSIELLNDKFKNLNLRTVAGPGAGYQIWEEPIKSLHCEGGLSYFSEDLIDGEDNQWLTARLACSLRYNFKDLFTFTDNLVIYPGFDSFGEYQLRNESSLSSPLGSNWSLRLANIYERDSDPPVNVEKDDWQWLLNLQYDFSL